MSDIENEKRIELFHKYWDEAQESKDKEKYRTAENLLIKTMASPTSKFKFFKSEYIFFSGEDEAFLLTACEFYLDYFLNVKEDREKTLERFNDASSSLKSKYPENFNAWYFAILSELCSNDDLNLFSRLRIEDYLRELVICYKKIMRGDPFLEKYLELTKTMDVLGILFEKKRLSFYKIPYQAICEVDINLLDCSNISDEKLKELQEQAMEYYLVADVKS